MADTNTTGAAAAPTPATTSTPPTTPGTNPSNGSEEGKLEEFKEAAEKIVKENETAEAFAEELFGRNTDDWANTPDTAPAQHQPSADDPLFGVDQSEEPGIAEVPEVHLTEYEHGHEHHEHPVKTDDDDIQPSETTDNTPIGDETPADPTTTAAAADPYYDYSAYGYDPNYANYDATQAAQGKSDARRCLWFPKRILNFPSFRFKR